MALLVAHGRMLVMPGYDSVKQKHYFRLLGGHVEFGERAEKTLRREMLEELGAEVEVGEQLDVVQNIFTYEDRPYHEIVFIYNACFVDDSFTRRDDLRNIEVDFEEPFEWHPIGELVNGPIPLYPTADYPGLLSRVSAC